MKWVEITELLGKTLGSVDVAEDKTEVIFTCSDGSRYRMFHSRDCCESVYLQDVIGNLDDLIGHPLQMAEEVSQKSGEEGTPPAVDEGWDDSYTWTFYKLATVQGYVTLRWYGTSNGYYSESVDLVQL